MTPCDDDLQMRAQCAFAVMMRMLMMTTGMDALSRGEGGFPMKHPCGPAQPCEKKTVPRPLLYDDDELVMMMMMMMMLPQCANCWTSGSFNSHPHS